jgi:hypothetical protein
MVITDPTRNISARIAGGASTTKIGTLFHYSHTSLSRWFVAIYLFFVLWTGCSIRETSMQVEIPYYRCYVFIRTLVERLKKNKKNSIDQGSTAVLLSGKVESDEFYIKSGLKGRSYHKQIVELGRAPRKRGLRSWRGAGDIREGSAHDCVPPSNGRIDNLL